MKLTVHLVHEADPRLIQRLDHIYTVFEHLQGQVAAVLSNQERIMATLDETLQAVNDESTQEDSIVVLLQQLREQIVGLTGGNLPPDVQAEVDAIFTKLQDNKTKLAAAIANTGSNPAPVPAPSPVATPLDPAGPAA